MNIHHLLEAPEASLASQLGTFERQFTYPLGEGRSFHVSHGGDYPRFFRAIGGAGSGGSFVAESGGLVLGTLGIALRPLRMPSGEIVTSAYIGDVKTAPGSLRGMVVMAMAARAVLWAKENGAVNAYAVVMDGTPQSPSTYSGRFGIPAFMAMSNVCLLRFPVPDVPAVEEGAWEVVGPVATNLFGRLSPRRFAPLGGSAALRCSFAPVHLAAPNGSACGILEDTLLAKRILVDDGSEMVSAHLSMFAHANPGSACQLLRQALARCGRLGFPALFVSVPACDLHAILSAWGDPTGIVRAPATIYAAGFPDAVEPWNLNTSEV